MAVGWQGWKRIVRKPLDLELSNGIRFRAYPDCTCSSAAVYYRTPNSRHIEFLRDCARGGTFLDVGANVGLVSMLLADCVSHALLFEPNPVAAARARENIRLNQLEFEVHEAALSDETGVVAFEDSGGVNPCNRTLPSAGGLPSGLRTITVPKFTFDYFRSGEGPVPGTVTAVKIDVEGHENSVLRGMRGLFLTDRPVVMFEYLQRTNLNDTFAIFAGVDYQVMHLSTQGLRPADLNIAPLQDLFALPVEHAERIGNAGQMLN